MTPRTGTTYRVPFWLVLDGDGVPRKKVFIRIRKESDGTYLQLDGASFASIPVDILMTEADPDGMPGYYYYDFDQSVDGVNDTYVVRFKIDDDELSLDEESFVRIDFSGAFATSAALSGEDFGGVIVRNIYDRANLGYKALFYDGIGLTRSQRMKKVIANRRQTKSAVTEGHQQAGAGFQSPT